MKLDFEHLKARHREVRDGFPTSLSLRTHRSLSWLQRAETESSDPDAQFLFLWIALNAAYAHEIHDRKSFSEMKLLMGFLGRLVDADRQRLLYNIVWTEFPKSIRLLLDNQYIYRPFWEFHNGLVDEVSWKASFASSKAAAHRAIGRMDTKRVLAVLLDRLYVLRNQLIHGGATWNSSVNRNQVQDGAAILGLLVPTIIHLMMEMPNQLWGEPSYPVIE